MTDLLRPGKNARGPHVLHELKNVKPVSTDMAAATISAVGNEFDYETHIGNNVKLGSFEVAIRDVTSDDTNSVLVPMNSNFDVRVESSSGSEAYRGSALSLHCFNNLYFNDYNKAQQKAIGSYSTSAYAARAAGEIDSNILIPCLPENLRNVLDGKVRIRLTTNRSIVKAGDPLDSINGSEAMVGMTQYHNTSIGRVNGCYARLREFRFDGQALTAGSSYTFNTNINAHVLGYFLYATDPNDGDAFLNLDASSTGELQVENSSGRRLFRGSLFSTRFGTDDSSGMKNSVAIYQHDHAHPSLFAGNLDKNMLNVHNYADGLRFTITSGLSDTVDLRICVVTASKITASGAEDWEVTNA